MSINPNFYYFERKCLVCGRPILLAENELHKPPVPCAVCVKGGTTTCNDKPQIRLAREERVDDDDLI